MLGWIGSQVLSAIWMNLGEDQLALSANVISFLLFLILLPFWAKIRWKDDHFFVKIGLMSSSRRRSISQLFKGLTYSCVLISFVLIPLLLTIWGKWLGTFSSEILLNALLLGLGVGFAEEMIFRGWLLTEMSFLFGNRLGLFIQAVIFSLVHIRVGLGLWSGAGLLLGLFLLGLLLALIRKIDKGSIWSCIGLHGGLVGGWFVISSGLVEFSSNTPGWLFGHGGSSLNPIGGLLGILALLMIIYRTAFAMAGRPFSGALNDSSRGALP